MLKDGDYESDGVGGLRRVEGQAELLQRVLFKLTARRGRFPFCKTLGSRLWQLGRLPALQRQSAAAQYVAEALAEERDLSVETVELGAERAGVVPVKVILRSSGEKLAVMLDIRI